MELLLRNFLTIGPIAIYVGGLLLTLWIVTKRRRTRWPFKLEDKLLRGPGESLLREVNRLNEAFIFEVFGGALAVVLFGGAVLTLAKQIHASIPVGIGMIGVVSAGISAISAIRITRLWRQRQAYYLGWFGERVVAEKLAPLRFNGWRVFHDVPFESNGKPFNIDHVVVGEGGLFVIETKARRKGGGPNSEPDDVVVFDGQALQWPRFKNDEAGLQQAEWNADLLTRWLKEEIGERVHASPILVIPGWDVKFDPKHRRRQCRVDSANWILNTFKDQRPCLSAKTVDLITRRLLAKCRDVED